MSLDLSLDHYIGALQVKRQSGQELIWDPIRKKWLVLQPEEMVRQLLIQYFLTEKNVEPSRVAVEKSLTVNELTKRCDLLIFHKDMSPWMLVECKAHDVELTEDTCWQIGIYNMPLQVPYLLVCNGPKSYCFSINFADSNVTSLAEVPKINR